MKNIIRPRHVALTALAAVLIAPMTQVQAREGRFHIPFLPNGVYTTDTINGNDARDSRDSTISRSDVPLDGRDGQPNSPAYAERVHGDRTSRYNTESGMIESQAANGLPATGVHDAGNGTVTAGRDSTTIHGDQRDAPPVGTGNTTLERDRTSNPSQATMPDDGAGEVGVPGPSGTTAQTDSFERNRDTAAGVESTRGAGGNGAAGTGGGGAGTGAGGAGAGAGAGGAGAGGAGAGAGGGGAGR